MADLWRNGHFALAGSGVTGLLGSGATSIASGVVMTLVGPDQLAAFFVGSWLAFVGCLFFYLAFRVTFPRADRRWYAVLVFLFPSLLFWTADVSKEAFMLLGLGLAVYGVALVLQGWRNGYVYLVAGGALCLVSGRTSSSSWRHHSPSRCWSGPCEVASPVLRRRHPLGMAAVFVFVAAIVVVSWIEAAHLLHSVSSQGLVNSLNTVASNNHGTGPGFGSSTITYSSNPLWYPRDIYTVLFDPLPFSAHNLTQFAAALENILILLVILFSLVSRLRHLPRVCMERPYVLMCLFYSAIFLYAFAALGNLGLITRERTLLLPILFVVFAFPIARPGAEPYPWQRRTVRRDSMRSQASVRMRRDHEPADATVVVASTAAKWAVAERPRSDESSWSVARWHPQN